MADTNKRNIPIKLGDFSVIDTEFSSIRERFDSEMRKMEEEMAKFRSELMNREANFFESTTRYARDASTCRNQCSLFGCMVSPHPPHPSQNTHTHNNTFIVHLS